MLSTIKDENSLDNCLDIHIRVRITMSLVNDLLNLPIEPYHMSRNHLPTATVMQIT
jgi:hypothetical protein